MRFITHEYGGNSAKFTASPVLVSGGFTLDSAQAEALVVGMVIPAGTLANVDEGTRLVKIITTARVISIDGSDAKKIVLQTYDDAAPALKAGDHLSKVLTGAIADTATIEKIEAGDIGLNVTLAAAITGLKVNDTLMKVIADGSTKIKLEAEPNAIVIEDAVVRELDEVPIDITRNTGDGEAYANRLPPVPSQFLEGNVLKGTKVSYTLSK